MQSRVAAGLRSSSPPRRCRRSSRVALWQYRGLGHVPHVEAAIDPHRLELLRQGFRDAFYSDRLAEAAFAAGVLGIARRSWPKSAFVAGWFLPYLLVRGSAASASFGTGGWFGALMPAFPAFVIGVCGLPLLVPRLGERLSRVRELAPPVRPERWVAAGAVAVAVVTILVVAALPLQKQPALVASAADRALVPVVGGFTPATGTKPGTVYLQWPAAKAPAGATPFYVVYRSPASVPDGIACSHDGAARCALAMQRLGSTPGLSYSDIAPPVPAGAWTYRIGLAANSAADSGGSGLMLLSPPVHVTRPRQMTLVGVDAVAVGARVTGAARVLVNLLARLPAADRELEYVAFVTEAGKGDDPGPGAGCAPPHGRAALGARLGAARRRTCGGRGRRRPPVHRARARAARRASDARARVRASRLPPARTRHSQRRRGSPLREGRGAAPRVPAAR